MASVAKRTWTHKGVSKTAWTLRYKDLTGVQRQETFELKKAADGRRREVEAELGRRTHTARGSSIRIAAAQKEYLAVLTERSRLGRRMEKTTLDRIERQIRLHVLPTFGETRVSDLDVGAVDRWLRDLTRAKKLSPGSARDVSIAFKGLLDFCIRREWCWLNVVAQVKSWPEHKGTPRSVVRTFTTEEVRLILADLENRPAKWTARNYAMLRCIVKLGAFCGLRFGEIMGLTWPMVDLECGYVRVRHSMTDAGNLKGPKTPAGNRDIPMSEAVITELREWRRHYVDNDLQLMFRTRFGNQVGRSNFHAEFWHPLLKRAGLYDGNDKFHFHALRHFTGSAIIEGGVPLTEAAQLMGHKTFDTTLQVYAHPLARGHKRHAVFEGVVSQVAQL